MPLHRRLILNDSGHSRRANGQLQIRRRLTSSGKLHPDIRVPFREISLAPTKSINGEIEINEPVRVYDTSGPWGDPDFHGDVTQGLPPLRAKWIRERGDVEEINGRAASPLDDGYLIRMQRTRRNGKRWNFEIRQRSRAGAPSRRAFAHPPVIP